VKEKVTGFVMKAFNTIMIDPIKFSVSPSAGKAVVDLFILSVSKTLSEEVNCQFGYFNKHGRMPVSQPISL
jgi:hypothetical protein